MQSRKGCPAPFEWYTQHAVRRSDQLHSLEDNTESRSSCLPHRVYSLTCTSSATCHSCCWMAAGSRRLREDYRRLWETGFRMAVTVLKHVSFKEFKKINWGDNEENSSMGKKWILKTSTQKQAKGRYEKCSPFSTVCCRISNRGLLKCLYMD